MNIYPTHTCFDDALEMLCEAIKANPGAGESDELLLVHGICLTPFGQEYAHAWVESLGKLAWFMGILDGKRQQFAAKIPEYYNEMNVVKTTKYTPRQAWKENNKHVTFGPWIEKYQKLCRQKESSKCSKI